MHKLQELIWHMRSRQIAILCIQETHVSNSMHFYEDGYLIVLSGGGVASNGRSYAGVGFVVSPLAAKSIIGFRLVSERLAKLRLKANGGVLNLVSAYAPHSGHDYEIRKEFFNGLVSVWKAATRHECTLALGDLNAKLFDQMAGDSDILGDFVFKAPLRKDTRKTNRELLLESCRTLGAVVANTFFAHEEEQLVTYYGLCAHPQDSITASSFSQIDFCLVDSCILPHIADIWSDRSASLQSHHFLVQARLLLEFPKQPKGKPAQGICNLSALRETASTQRGFCERFCDTRARGRADESLDAHAANVAQAMHTASVVARCEGFKPHRPWISSQTLLLLEKRSHERQLGHHDAERELHKQIRRNIKRDRSDWLDAQLAGGPWHAARSLRKGTAKKPVGVKNVSNVVVDSADRADTMADYFENIQWAVTFAELQPSGVGVLGPTLAINVENFSIQEVRRALVTLSTGKAPGGDDVPPEFWKVLLQSNDAVHELLLLLQACWNSKDIPEQWRVATVVLLYEKGDASLPENYRPISLLSIGYKVLASILQKRLENGGSEERVRTTQYGFRPKRGTVQAISIARRIIDAAYSSKHPGVIAILLDWAKAFDRIKPDALVTALERFGLPAPMLHMIASIYRSRSFVLKDVCGNSTLRPQRAGIAQGCPLSPYLFILVQTVLLADVDDRLAQHAPFCEEPAYIVCTDLLYADDTMLIGSDPRRLQLHLDLLIDEGRRYGLELNMSKTLLMRVRNSGIVRQPSGEPLKCVDEAVYLGGLLSSSGSARSELTRRIGEATGIFNSLRRCWAHANITRARKLELYKAIVLPKLLYNLESIWLLQDDLSRLDSFHARCLRKICRILPSFISRISNQHVLDVAMQPPLSRTLQERQMKLYSAIAQMPDDSYIRRLICKPGTNLPVTWYSNRKRGRPKQQWAPCVHALLCKAVHVAHAASITNNN